MCGLAPSLCHSQGSSVPLSSQDGAPPHQPRFLQVSHERDRDNSLPPTHKAEQGHLLWPPLGSTVLRTGPCLDFQHEVWVFFRQALHAEPSKLQAGVQVP